MEVRLIACTEKPEEIIEKAYLSCRNKYDDVENIRKKRTFEERIAIIFTSGHFSVLEHANATFLITGISRACSHQLVRHRIASYSQISLRHTDAENLEFIVPTDIRNNIKAFKLYRALIEDAKKTYKELRALGIKQEDARFCIPMGIETQIIFSMNFRSLIHFLKLRMAPNAQWEIRELAKNIHNLMKNVAPNVFNDKYKQYWE